MMPPYFSLEDIRTLLENQLARPVSRGLANNYVSNRTHNGKLTWKNKKPFPKPWRTRPRLWRAWEVSQWWQEKFGPFAADVEVPEHLRPKEPEPIPDEEPPDRIILRPGETAWSILRKYKKTIQ